MNSKTKKLKEDSKLKQRILTASVLAIFIIVAIFLLPRLEFNVIIALILAIAAWEWSRLIGLTNKFLQTIYILLIVLIFIIGQSLLPLLVLFLSIIFWFYAIFLVYHYSQEKILIIANKTALAIVGIFVLVPSIVAFSELRDQDPRYLLYGLFLIWATDTGAFMFGKFWGRHKLAPNISPGKTIEGVLGGIILALVIAAVGALLLHIPYQRWPAIFILTIIVSLASVLGDLFESMIKRWAGVKDSSRWLPGHGGLLDRIDGLLCALPVFALGLSIIHL